jgi:hypothetical protein
VIAAIGKNNVTQVSENYRKWDQAKNILYSAAKALLAKESTSFDDQQEMVNTIKQFVDCTKDMNASYTAEVLRRLHEEIYPKKRRLRSLPSTKRETMPTAASTLALSRGRRRRAGGTTKP